MDATTSSALEQRLTLFDMIMIAVGSTIGSGIFLTPSMIAGALPSPHFIVIVWILGGIMALSGALTYAELGALFPKAGGVYVFLKESYGEFAGFLFGWAYFLVVNTGAIAALSIAFATYFGYFVPLSPAGIKLCAVSGIVIVTAINVRGVKTGGIFSDVFTVLKLVGIAGIIVIGFLWGNASKSDFTSLTVPGNLSGGFAIAMVGVLWSYGGWQHATFASAEAKQPHRTIPLAMVIGAMIVTLVYVSVNVAYLFLLTPGQIAHSSSLAADAVETVIGRAGGGAIAVAIFISTFGTTGIFTLTAPRIYYAMASDGLFIRTLAKIHPQFHTPANAILIQSLWAIVLILFWGTFENLISYVVFTDWIFFALTAASVFVFRRKFPNRERRYKTFGYPVTPLIFISFALWFVVSTLIEKPAQAWAGILMLLLGLPVFYAMKKKRAL